MDETRRRARNLIMAYGWNAVCYQILNPGITLWFSAERDAVAGYVACAGYWMVGGAPVCAPGRVGEVLLELEAAARSADCRVCYFGAAERLYDACKNPPAHSVVELGAQPIWNPARWASILAGHASLRAQLYRARNKGVCVRELNPTEAHGSPELQRCLNEWIARRPMPPMHFLVEPETLRTLDDRRVFVAERRGRAVGFLVASPIPCRDGWLVEQIIRGAEAPNGTNELLLDAAMRAFAEAGNTYVTLGLVPLSRRAARPTPTNPLWLRFALGWVRAHGNRFYHFEGLDCFKAKFQPDSWELIFAISNERRFSPRTLYAIAAAFSDGPPALMVARAFVKAARQEVRWAVRGEVTRRAAR